MLVGWFFRFIDWAWRTRWMTTLVLLACFGVGGWGFYAYYGPQFDWVGAEHWYTWPFIPDCPLFVYLYAFVVLGHWFRIQHPAFTALVALGNVKYGVWTVFVLFYYFDRFFDGGDAALRTAILFLHVGMVPMGIQLWRTLPRLKAWHYGAILGVFLLYDYMDYWFTLDYQVYPIGIPSASYGVPLAWDDPAIGVVPAFTVVESLVLVGALALVQARLRAPLMRPENVSEAA